MRLRLVAASAAACLGLTAAAAWLFDWSFARAATLSPVIVVAAGAAAGLVVLWTRVVWESLRRRDRR